MATYMQVRCALCNTKYTRTVKQVNQTVKKKGRWACVSCMAGHKAVKIEGQTFGRLTVLMRAGSQDYGGSKKSLWLCACECGNTVEVVGSLLARGHTKSCGCLKKEAFLDRVTTHGSTETREHRIWQAMRSRCRNESASGYSNYGGRGITVCERWDSFEAFLEDMGTCPADHSIERIDVNGNYEPSNCIWADRITQARNTRANRNLTLNGETKCLKEWADDLGMDQASLRERLDKWPLEKALTEPKRIFS